jgi:hypothetical protein
MKINKSYSEESKRQTNQHRHEDYQPSRRVPINETGETTDKDHRHPLKWIENRGSRLAYVGLI